MGLCCDDKGCEIERLRAQHGRVLKTVLLINAGMFVVEAAAGWLAHSTALLADSLDMLGDALVYGFSLYVLTRSAAWQAAAALAKALFMWLFGVLVLAEAGYKIAYPVLPDVELMGGIGVLALIANSICFALLYRHRDDNLNLRSTWLCSRNDLIANSGVLAAALLTFVGQSRWPDIIVGVVIAAVFLMSAARVLTQALMQLRAERRLARGLGVKRPSSIL
jgi:cation diffusion facilitator family transporter